MTAKPPKRPTWTEERIRACGVRMDGIDAVEAVAGYRATRAYELLRKPDQLPFRVLKIGRRFVVPTADVLAVLGLDRQPQDP